MRCASVLLSLLPHVAEHARHVEADGEARERLPVERGLDAWDVLSLHSSRVRSSESGISVKSVAAVLK